MKIKFDITVERERTKVYALMKEQEEFERFGEISSRSVNTFSFSTRIVNALYSEHILTVGELCVLPAWHLERIPNMGSKSIAEIKEKLAKTSLKLPFVSPSCPRCSL